MKKDQDKSKEELLLELQALREAYGLLTTRSANKRDALPEKEPQPEKTRPEPGKKAFKLPASIHESDLLKVIRRLEVHMIEVELQNEELKRMRNEAEASSKTLIQSEERFNALFQGNHSVLLLIDPDTGEIKDANDAASVYYGWSHDEICSKHISEINTLSRDELIREMNLARNEDRQHFSFRHRLANGEVRDVDVYSGPIQFGDQTYLYSVVHDVSSRKKAENALMESESRYRELMQNLDVGVIVHAPDTSIITNNPKASELLGIREDKMKGVQACDYRWNFIDENHDPISLDEYPVMWVIKHKKSFKARVIGIVSSEKRAVIWVLCSGFPVFHPDGFISEVVISFSDITIRRNALDALKESEEKFSTAFRTSPYVITISRLDNGKFIEINDTFSSILGISREEAIGSTAVDLNMWADHGDRDRIVTHLQEQKEVSGMEVLFRTKTREILTGLLSAQVIHIRNTPYILTSIEDITSRKRMEVALRESEAMYRSILLASPDDITIADMDGTIRMTSPVAVAMFGYASLEDLIGRSIYTFLTPASQVKALAAIERIYKGIPLGPDAYIGVRKDGTIFHVEANAEFIRDEEGKATSLVIIVRDITERKQAEMKLEKSEEALQKLNAELEKRVTDRTVQLTDANHELESFAHTISHDLRAPLRHIKGFIDILKEDNSAGWKEEHLKYMGFIHNSALEMDQLIEALLSFSRINRAEIKKERIRMSGMVDDVIKYFYEETTNRNITFNIGPLADATGDEKLIRQVWINLVSNAIKYTGKAKEAIIEIGCTESTKETVYFVRDNGAGFDMRYVGNLFNVFQRLHRATDFDGVGVGLANVKRIVVRHGGHCAAVGEVGKGAMITFSLLK